MDNAIHISIDIETWGTDIGCDIRSIGACVFNPHNPDWYQDITTTGIMRFYSACDNPTIYISGDPQNFDSYGLKYNLVRNTKTVQWWESQPKEAQDAFNNPVDLKQVLMDFTTWLRHVSGVHHGLMENIRLWGHGAAFDVPRLEAAYEAVDLPVPWHYRVGRDTRTAFDLAEEYDHSSWMKQHREGVLHHALWDAISQAKAICGAYERVRTGTGI